MDAPVRSTKHMDDTSPFPRTEENGTCFVGSQWLFAYSYRINRQTRLLFASASKNKNINIKRKPFRRNVTNVVFPPPVHRRGNAFVLRLGWLRSMETKRFSPWWKGEGFHLIIRRTEQLHSR